MSYFKVLNSNFGTAKIRILIETLFSFQPPFLSAWLFSLLPWPEYTSVNTSGKNHRMSGPFVCCCSLRSRILASQVLTSFIALNSIFYLLSLRGQPKAVSHCSVPFLLRNQRTLLRKSGGECQVHLTLFYIFNPQILDVLVALLCLL